jgi:hypothetical protein
MGLLTKLWYALRKDSGHICHYEQYRMPTDRYILVLLEWERLQRYGLGGDFCPLPYEYYCAQCGNPKYSHVAGGSWVGIE